MQTCPEVTAGAWESRTDPSISPQNNPIPGEGKGLNWSLPERHPIAGASARGAAHVLAPSASCLQPPRWDFPHLPPATWDQSGARRDLGAWGQWGNPVTVEK